MIMIDADDLDWMEKDWPLRKKIEWIICNQYPRRKKFKVPETVDRILEVFKDYSEKGDEE